MEPEDPVAETPGEPTLLVSEFPPPPFYYKRYAELSPPPIPQEALARGTARAAAQAAKARAESERLRLGQEQGTDAILGGETEDEEGDVVAVFGEVVEDPLLFEPLDHCEDPQVVCEEMKRLNHEVLKGFIKLTQNLVHDPAENKQTRDTLSHNVFLMLQECNKFREHQAREILIDLLERQLEERKLRIERLKECIAEADRLLE